MARHAGVGGRRPGVPAHRAAGWGRGRSGWAGAAGAGHSGAHPRASGVPAARRVAPVGVFTGGSLLVGSAARTDLRRADRTEELARAQYRSLRRLTALGDDLPVWPTHGAGSFCSAPPGAEGPAHRHGEGHQPAAARPRRGRLRAALLDSLGSFPPYFLRLGEINRRGPACWSTRRPAPTARGRRCVRCSRRAVVVDVRPRRPRSPPATRWVAVHPAPAGVRHLARLARPTRRAAGDRPGRRPGPGRDRLAGREDRLRQPHRAARRRHGRLGSRRRTRVTALAGHPGDIAGAGCSTSGRPRSSTPVTCPARRTSNSATSPPAPPVPPAPLVLMCGHGERAMSAASLLARAGHHDLAVLDGGPDDWAAATGRPAPGA